MCDCRNCFRTLFNTCKPVVYSVPDSVARALSAHTLPDNMMSFVRAARAAAPSEPR